MGVEGTRRDAARARHRPQRVRRLPRLRDELQGVEHVGLGGAARGHAPLRPGPDRHVLQPRADVRGGRIPEHADRAFPEVVPALRGPAVRARVPDRRELQAQGRRHRARRLRQVHRLQVLRMGVPVGRARARLRAPRDDEVHAVRRPDLRHVAAAGGASAGMRDGMSHQRAPVRRHSRSAVRGVEGDPRERRLPADAGVGHEPIESLSAAAQDRGADRGRSDRPCG
jgi:hypothetical protein